MIPSPFSVPCLTEPRARAVAISGWRLLVDPPGDGAWNMAVDEAIATAVGEGGVGPTLRLYGWSHPTVSLGFLQRASIGADLAACRRRGIPVVRRLTGGRAVLHAEELTYSVALPLAGPWGELSVAASFRAINAGLLEMLRRLGVAASVGPPERHEAAAGDTGLCFLARRMPAILVAGRKLIGSAQRRAASWLLQHGSLLLELDETLHRELFPAWPGAGASGVTCLREVLGRRPSGDELSATLQGAWTAALGGPCRPGRLTSAELREAERLAKERYAAASWTWQR